MIDMHLPHRRTSRTWESRPVTARSRSESPGPTMIMGGAPLDGVTQQNQKQSPSRPEPRIVIKWTT